MQPRAFHLTQTGSTNDDAARLFAEHRCPVVVTADEQSTGRGRLGHSWHSPWGGLWWSLAVPYPAGPSALDLAPLAAGLAAAEAVADLGTPEMRSLAAGLTIKWPNDVLVEGLKLVGVLCERRETAAGVALVIGIGINANFAASILPQGLRQQPTSILDQTGVEIDLAELAGHLLTRVSGWLAELTDTTDAPADLVRTVDARLAHRGKRVLVGIEGRTEPTEGILVGIDHRGRLLLRTEAGTTSLSSGEITPISDPIIPPSAQT